MLPSRADRYTVRKSQTDLYSDFTTNFFSHPDTNQLIRVVNEEAVKRSIRNLIFTNNFERLFQPEFGGNIQKYLFEDVSSHTEISLKTKIKNTIQEHEPRAQLIDVLVQGIPEENGYIVSIIFSIASNINPITMNLTLGRLR